MNTYKRLVIGGAGALMALGLMFSAVPAQAASLTEAQVSAIIALLSSFGADQSVISNVKISLMGGAPSSGGGNGGVASSTPGMPGVGHGPYCIQMMHAFGLGAQDRDNDGEVSKLQEVLHEHGYLNTSATGYFGPMTQVALRSYQSANGIPAVGQVGPATRAKMMYNCPPLPGQPGDGRDGGDPGMNKPSVSLTATPAFGIAPFATNLTATFGSMASSSNRISIDYGDGQHALICNASYNGTNAVAACSPTMNLPHTYTNPGTYTATITAGPNCPSGAMCPMYLMLLARTTVVVRSAESVSSYSCSIKPSATVVNSGEQFTLTWTSNIPSPTRYEGVPAGGYVATTQSGTLSWTAEKGPGTDTFSIGTGTDTTFKPYCTTRVYVRALGDTSDPYPIY